MRVAIFTDNDFEKVNGVTTTLRAVLQHAPDGMDLRVYTCESVGVAMPEYLGLKALGIGIPYYRGMNVYLPPLRRFLRHALADGVELVHLTTPGPVGLAAVWVASRLRVPMIGSFHTDLGEYARQLSGSKLLGGVVHHLVKWPYGKCERIFVPSEATRQLLLDSRMAPTKIDTWRRGVSTIQFDPAKRSATVRTAWGASEDRPALIYVGRVSREKGLSGLGPMTEKLERAGRPHALVIVGDGPMRDELRATCPNAIFTGTLRPDEVAVAMASADLFVFPSRTDTAGNVVLEAQASGLPVLVTDEGGPRENMRPFETGYVCCDEAELFNRASELLRDGNRRRRLGTAARQYAHTRRWDLALEPLYRAYEALGAARQDAVVGAPAMA